MLNNKDNGNKSNNDCLYFIIYLICTYLFKNLLIIWNIDQQIL